MLGGTWCVVYLASSRWNSLMVWTDLMNSLCLLKSGLEIVCYSLSFMITPLTTSHPLTHSSASHFYSHSPSLLSSNTTMERLYLQIVSPSLLPIISTCFITLFDLGLTHLSSLWLTNRLSVPAILASHLVAL